MAVELRIMHWNANGNCNSAMDRLALYTQACNLDLNLICINEAHNENVFLPDFISIKCSKDLIILAKRDVRFSIIRKHSSPCADFVFLQIAGTIYVFSYLRDGKSAEGISSLLEAVLLQWKKNPNMIIIGDLNARMEILGNRSSNCAGTTLGSFLDAFEDFVVLNEPGV
jgi:hypothetical protein